MNCNKANSFNNVQVNQQLQVSNLSLQGHGLGVLVLPDGETLTLLPQANDLSEIVTPAVEESMNQSFSLPSSRLVRFIVPREEKVLTFDKAIVSDIKTMRSEWYERRSRNEEEDDQAQQRKKKNKKRLKRLKKSKFSFKKVCLASHERTASSPKTHTYKTMQVLNKPSLNFPTFIISS
jgi:hypothetical protein